MLLRQLLLRFFVNPIGFYFQAWRQRLELVFDEIVEHVQGYDIAGLHQEPV